MKKKMKKFEKKNCVMLLPGGPPPLAKALHNFFFQIGAYMSQWAFSPI